MTVYQDLRDLANYKSMAPSWWRSQLFFYLSGRGLDSPAVGGVCTFKYTAEYAEKYQFWDKCPMVYVIGESSEHFWGANVHYLPPQARVSGFSPSPPPVTLHKYLRSNVISPYYSIENSEWADIGLIPSEEFVTTINGRNIPVPTSAVLKKL